MSSVQSYIKQQRIVYGAMPPVTSPGAVVLNTFTRNPFVPSDPNSTSGHFAETSPAIDVGNDASGLRPIFRDMGEVIRSAGRTFRRVQLLSSSAATFGVTGEPSTNAVVSDYQTYWYEVSLVESGAGVVNNLFQIQG